MTPGAGTRNPPGNSTDDVTYSMGIFNPLAQKKVLVVHHWPYAIHRKPIFSDSMFYVGCKNEEHESVINVPRNSHVDISGLVQELKKKYNWAPDLFVAKVDAFFRIIPRNVSVLECPKVLILGDTQHGVKPLANMIDYATSEKYDFYITDHKRHHLWFYHLAGIKKSYWLPGLFLKPPQPGFEKQPLSAAHLNPDLLTNRAVFIGQVDHHPRRVRIFKELRTAIPYFTRGMLGQADSLKAYNLADISLNISLNGDLNLRCMEIISAGGTQISDRLSDESGLNLILKEDEEIILFDTIDEILEKIHFYHNNRDLNNKIRENAFQRYQKEYAPEKMLKIFNDIIENREIEERYTSASLSRIKHIPDSVFSHERIRVYEFVQEQHKNAEFLKILFDGRVDFSAPEDFLDLPRLEIVVINLSMEKTKRLEKYIQAAPDANRLKIVGKIGTEDKFDLLIVPNLDVSLLVNFRSGTSTIIYQDQAGISWGKKPNLVFASRDSLEQMWK